MIGIGNYQLYAKLSKCTSSVDTIVCIDLLEFVINPKGFQLEGARVATIREWPEPSNVKEVQSFGFAYLYRPLQIENMSVAVGGQI